MNINFPLNALIGTLAILILLSLGAADLPHSFWMTTRTIISGACVLIIFNLSQKNVNQDINSLVPAFALILLLYNPVWPTYLYVQWIWALANAYSVATCYYGKEKIRTFQLYSKQPHEPVTSSFIKFFETWWFVGLIVLAMIIFGGSSEQWACVRLKHGTECF